MNQAWTIFGLKNLKITPKWQYSSKNFIWFRYVKVITVEIFSSRDKLFQSGKHLWAEKIAHSDDGLLCSP